MTEQPSAELEPAPLVGIVHPPDSIVPYVAAVDDAIRDLAEQADLPPEVLGLP